MSGASALQDFIRDPARKVGRNHGGVDVGNGGPMAVGIRGTIVREKPGNGGPQGGLQEGRTEDSEWRCWMSDLSRDQVAMRRAWFWMRCSLPILVLQSAGNQVGAAYLRIGLMMALNVSRIVSLSWPQEVLTMALRTWRRLETLAAMSDLWRVKVNRGSKVTRSILGFLLVGTGKPSMVSRGLTLTWLVQWVKRVTDDLSGAMPILLALPQSAMEAKVPDRSSEIDEASREMSGCDTAMVTSSA